ncbi:MAG: DMT family transporter [Anaerovoracaceae bacterium]
MSKNNKIIGIICIVITTIAYGLIPSLSFLSFNLGVAAETLLFNKFLYAAIAMWAYILIKKVDIRLRRDQIMPMIVIAVAYIGIATTLYLAFNYISGSLATIISFTFPAIILTIEMVRKRIKANFLIIFAVIMSMFGMILIAWSPDLSGNLIGIIFAFGTAISYAVYILGLASDKMKRVNSLVVAGYVLVSSALVNFFRCCLSGKQLFAVEFNQLLVMLLLAIVCAFIAILCYCIGVKKIGAVKASIINTFEPVVACLFGYFLIGDSITLRMIIGATVIIISVLIANLSDKKTLEHFQ